MQILVTFCVINLLPFKSPGGWGVLPYCGRCISVGQIPTHFGNPLLVNIFICLPPLEWSHSGPSNHSAFLASAKALIICWPGFPSKSSVSSVMAVDKTSNRGNSVLDNCSRIQYRAAFELSESSFFNAAWSSDQLG